jgi:prepilin-type N-terminal cleavage/methylation domain-containing protein
MLIVRHRAQDGFTLVELLVVLLLFGVISSIIAGAMIRGLRADAQAQSRIEAFEDMQLALERVSRDVRAASMPLEMAEPDEIRLRLLRDGSCLEYTYWVDDADSALYVSERRSTDGCATFGPAAERVLVPGLQPNSDVFTYESDQYDAGERMAANPVTRPDFVTITFTRTLFEQRPVTVSTVVGLRNAR